MPDFDLFAPDCATCGECCRNMSFMNLSALALQGLATNNRLVYHRRSPELPDIPALWIELLKRPREDRNGGILHVLQGDGATDAVLPGNCGNRQLHPQEGIYAGCVIHENRMLLPRQCSVGFVFESEMCRALFLRSWMEGI